MESQTKTNVILWGFGYTNKSMMYYLLEKGYNIVGVISRGKVGEDAYKLADIKSDKELLISSYLEADKTLKEMKVKPDVCIISTFSFLSEISDHLKILAENKINVVTVSEECLYSYYTSPVLTEEISEIFAQNGVSYTGAGFNDIFLGEISKTFINSTHQFEKLSVNVRYNLDSFGIVNADNGIGLSEENFREKVKFKGINLYSNYWLSAAFGWKVLSQTTETIPILLRGKDYSSNNYGTIKENHVIGYIDQVTSILENGITLVSNLESLIFHSECDKEITEWVLEGKSKIRLACEGSDSMEVTCTCAINRIHQLIRCDKKGYVPSFLLCKY